MKDSRGVNLGLLLLTAGSYGTEEQTILGWPLNPVEKY